MGPVGLNWGEMENQTTENMTPSAELAFGFTGNIALKLDTAQRVQVPARFKEVLDKRFGSSGGRVTVIPWGKRIVITPAEVWPKYQQEMEAMGGKFNSNAARVRSLIVGQMDVIGLDGQGRIKLTPRMCDKVGLTKEVVLVGVGEQMELWDAQAWDEFSAVDLDTVLGATDGLQA